MKFSALLRPTKFNLFTPYGNEYTVYKCIGELDDCDS